MELIGIKEEILDKMRVYNVTSRTKATSTKKTVASTKVEEKTTTKPEKDSLKTSSEGSSK